MFDWITFLKGFTMIFHVKFFLYMFCGVSLGLVLGAMPGLTGSMGIGLMLPFTYNMDSLSALVFLLSIYSGGLFGGAITAILLNTPGAPANMATLFDGYPMTLRGKASKALGVGLLSSVIGGIIGCIMLLLIMEPLADLSLQFGPSEMFMVAIFGLTIIGSLSKDIFKSLFAGMLGVLIGTIGMSSIGNIRGTFGSMYLLDGVPLIPTLIGFLALPELFNLVSREFIITEENIQKSKFADIFSGFKEVIIRPFLTLRSAIIGVIVGIMPAAGATVASLLSYNQAKQWSKRSDEYGTGIPEGVIATETANNASEGGALATMLVIGLPGSASTAMLLGALLIQGWIPGPRLFLDNREIIYASISSLFIQQFVMLVIGLIICIFAAQIIMIPTKYLIPCIMLFTIIGSFSTRNAIFDSALMLGFGILGWFMKKTDFPVMPVVLGVILGPIADKELLRILQIYEGNFLQIFTRPITLILFLISVLSVILPLILEKRKTYINAGKGG
ncbi:MAG: tripartite tricarboxylate transporter permease [Peptococcaceae bacterium]